jgi:hypothetical protein
MWGGLRSDFGSVLASCNPMNSNDRDFDSRTESRIRQFPLTILRFLRSSFGISPETDPEWFPVRPLGQGAFGEVALWERRSGGGIFGCEEEVVEETAVKQAMCIPSQRLGLAGAPFLAREAAVMQQLNERGSDNVVYLKAFKCFDDTKHHSVKGAGGDTIWRFYFEYCPYGDLGRLKKRYAAWGYVMIFPPSTSSDPMFDANAITQDLPSRRLSLVCLPFFSDGCPDYGR